MPNLAAISVRDPDDAPFETATVLARLDELRRRLIVSVLALAVAFVVCFWWSEDLYELLIAPLRSALPPGGVLIATRVPEVFVLHLHMSLFAAFFLAAPVWLYQAWRFARFVAPLRRGFLPIVFFACGLFVLGAAFGHYVLFPYAVRFLTTVGSSSARIMLSVGSVFSFYARFVLGLGLAFQIPTAVLVLSLLDLVSPRLLVRQLRIVTLAVFVFAAILTPTPDLVTQCLLAFPMLGLYLFSIGLSWLVARRRK